jgi:alcohol dehydrogenase
VLQHQNLDVTPTGRIVFGCGAIGRLGELVAGLGASRLLVVSDAGVVASGVTGRVQAILAAADLEVSLFAGVAPNPSSEDVATGSTLLQDLGVADSAVVAVGGGSAIDAAKAIALHAPNGGRVFDLDYRVTPARPGRPLIAVPTTAGTGAETNAFGVITDLETGRKGYIGHASVLPRASVLDPELTVGLPPGPTAATGIDALTHALESLMSINANPYAEGLCLQVIRTVGRWLPTAVATGHDLEARSQLLLAAHLAGLAMGSGTGLGLCHAVGHPLGARLGAPHGVALAAVLPHVLRFNLPTSADRLALAARSLDVFDPRLTVDDNAGAAIGAIESLIRQVLPAVSLTGLGVTRDNLAVLVQDAIDDVVMANTPRQPTSGEVEELLVAAL